MQGDPRDTGAYRIAVGAVGFALIVVLAGLCVIVAVGQGTEIPKELWTITSALGGGLLGLLAPSPTPSSAGETEQDKGEEQAKTVPERVSRSFKRLAKDAGANRSVVILLLVFAFSVGFGAVNDSAQFQALAGASGGALIGLLAPAPDKRATER
jgi:predicted PurR-regulated permease PerM